MANIQTFPRKLQLDNDLRTLEPEDARYLLNTRGYSSSGTDAMSLENIKSMVEATYTEATGENVVVGSIAHPENNDIYIFVWNAGANHRVLRYNTILDKVTIVMESSLLGFNKKCFVQGFAITSQSPSETLLYWTDGVTQPKKINVARAILRQSGDFVNGYKKNLTLEMIRWIKYLPLNEPTFVHGKDGSVGYNNLAENVFQFRYRYVHKDGERSAYSPASKATFSDYQLRSGVFQLTKTDFFFNYVDITVDNSWGDVEEIELVCKNINSTEWTLITILDNDTTSSTQTYRFFNDDVYISTDSFETAKSYDAVPLKAVSVENVHNRAIFGNAVDGYDNLDKDEIDLKSTLYAGYKPSGEIKSDDILFNQSFGNDELTVTFLMSTLTVTEGDAFYIVFNVWLDEDKSGKGAKKSTGKFFYSYVSNATDTIADVVNYFTGIMVGDVNDDVKIYTATNSSNDLVLTIDFAGTELIDSSTSKGVQENKSYQIKDQLGVSSFKAGAKHPIGIIYYDEAGRTGSVQRSKENEPYVSWFSERGNVLKSGNSYIDSRLGFIPPVWAEKYRYVYAGNKSIGDFLQYSLCRAYINTDTKEDDKSIYLTFNTFQGSIDDRYHRDAYKTSTGVFPEYNFKEGDRLRIISYIPAGSVNGEDDRIRASEYLDFKIASYQYLESDDETNPIYPSNPTGVALSKFGWTIVLDNPERQDEWGWEWLSNNPNDSNWSIADSNLANSAVFEVYSPENINSNDVYYETSYTYDIGNAGLPTRYHKGDRDQYEPYTLTEFSVSSIDTNRSVFYNSLDLKLFIGDVVNFTGGTASPSGDFTIIDIVVSPTPFSLGRYEIYFDKDLNVTLPEQLGDTVLKDLYAATKLEEGDVWIKARKIITGSYDINLATPRNIIYSNIEDYYANDFFESKEWACKGRVQGYSEYAKQEDRKASVWLSEAYFPANNTNGLSAFNLANTDSPLKEYDRSLGSIQKLWRRGDELIMLQENKISLVRVGKDVITTGDGGSIITLTSSVLSEQIPYKGDFGISMNPESFASKDGNAYFLDIKRGKVLRLGADGLTPISDNGISAFLDGVSKEYNKIVNSTGFKAYGGFDREHDEYNLTFGQVVKTDIAVGENPIGDIPQATFRRITPITASNGGILGNGAYQSLEFNFLTAEPVVEEGDTFVLSFEDSVTVSGEDPQVTDWYTSYTAVEGDDQNAVMNALGASLVGVVVGDTLMSAFENTGDGVLKLRMESLLVGDLADSDFLGRDTSQDRETDNNPTDIYVELPYKESRVPREVIDYDGIPTEADVFNLDDLSVFGFVPLNKDTILPAQKTATVGLKALDLTLYGDYNIDEGRIKIPVENNLTSLSGSQSVKVTPTTIAFHEGSKSWAGFRSYTPNGYANVNFIMLSFMESGIWKHDRGVDYNTFYGTQYPSRVSAVLVAQPSVNTVFNSLSTESNVPMNVELAKTNLNSTEFTQDRFEEKEGIWYADLSRATSTVSTTNSNRKGIGNMFTQSGTGITFGFNLQELGLSIGDEVINANTGDSMGVITAFFGNSSLLLSINAPSTQGDFMYAVKSSKVEGDAIRGVYLRVDLEKDSNGKLELFAVNTNAELSNLTLPQK